MADFEQLCKETKQLEKTEQKELSIGYLKSYGGSEVQQAVLELRIADYKTQTELASSTDIVD